MNKTLSNLYVNSIQIDLNVHLHCRYYNICTLIVMYIVITRTQGHIYILWLVIVDHAWGRVLEFHVEHNANKRQNACLLVITFVIVTYMKRS